MTDQAERYDRIAAGYGQWWAPVLARDATAVLDEVDGEVRAGARDLIDVGTGTGTLAIAAVRRWPGITITAVDISAGMAAAAGREADAALPSADRKRLRTAVAPADDLPFSAASFDVAISSFVYQLVPNRFRALREVHRVLRPGGLLAYVTWLADARAFAPDEDLDATLDEIGVGAREWDDRPGDVPSVEAAAAQLRRAGFRDVRAVGGLLEHPFEREGYLRFVTEFDEEDLVASFEPDLRHRFDDRLRSRLAARRHDELVLRLPIVRVVGRRN